MGGSRPGAGQAPRGSPMKILLVDKNLVEPFHRAKWRALAETPGITLSAVAPARWRENYRNLVFRPGPSDGFPITPLPTAWQGREARGFYWGGLKAAFRRAAPDVVIAFEEPYGLFAWQCIQATDALARRPTVALYSWDNLSDRHRYPYRGSALLARIERHVMRRARQLWCANRDAVHRYEPAYPGKVRLLPFALDLERFRGESARPLADDPERAFHVGYVGRILAMKGLDTLVDAVARLPPTTRLTLVGSGPQRGELAARVATAGLGARVCLEDSVPAEAIPARLRAFDALVLPSRTTPRWKEQFGRVLVEAMAAGVPVVGSSSGAIPEVVGDAGIIFPEGDVEALSAALDALQRDPTLRMSLSERGLARAEEFGTARFAARVRALLEEMVSA